MLEKYRVVKENKEEILYLYLTMDYEFASDFTDQDLTTKTKNWLCNQRIQFEGNKVVFVINGIPSKIMLLEEQPLQDDETTSITLENNQTVTLKDFLLSVLLSNITIELAPEALKAVIILYRSEAMHYITQHQKVKRYNSHFSYIDKNYYKLLYPETYHFYEKNYQQAIKETNGQYLVYQKKPIHAYLHLASNGYTEEKEGTPYLQKKESLWDLAYPYYFQTTYYSVEQLKNKLNLKENTYDVEIKTITNSNRIKELRIGPKILNQQDLMVYLQLPSTDATILMQKDGVLFITRGSGHGYGLSLVGANFLASLEYNYKQILNYYLKDVQLVTQKI